MTVINTNVGALTARTYSIQANDAMQKSMERLSSGLRINSAADDAAGLAVANKMESQLRGMNVAIRNSQDGISLVQTAEAGMGEISNMVIRMRELAVQMNNGVYTSADRANAQLEVAALLAEIDKIADNTAFNDVKVLDGSYSADIRAGNTNAEIITVTIDRMKTDTIGGDYITTGVVQGAASTDAALTAAQYATNGTTVVTVKEGDKVTIDADVLSGQFGSASSTFKSVFTGGTFSLTGTDAAKFDIDANGIVAQEFEIDRAAEFLDAVRLELDDSPVFFDNNLYLTLNNIEKLSIIEITEPNAGGFINRLFSDNELFDLESFNVGNLDLNKLKNADLIVLNGLTSLSNQLTQSLNTFLDGNGSVVIIPSNTNTPNTYANLGMNLASDSKERLALNSPDMQNPFFDGIFEEDSENIAMPTATTSLRLRNISASILNFRNGRSFLAKAERTGNLYFYSCGFDAESTSFPSHSLFVPVMYKIALGSNVNLNTLYYSTDQETIEYPLPRGFTSNNIVTLSNGTIQITPDQRVSADKLIMILPKDQIKEGHYELMTDGNVLGAIAFNNPKAESGNATISTESLRNAVDPSVHLYLIQAASGLEVNQNLIAGIKGVSLWKYAILFSLLFLFVEVILIRYL
mgnify:CR=1 FL=1